MLLQLRFVAIGFALAFVCGARADDFAARYEAEVRPLLVKYCERCHNHEKSEGELNLAKLDAGNKAISVTIWPTVIKRFSMREMPPEGEPQPNDREREVLFHWMQDLLAADDGNCNKLATDVTQHFYKGNVMSRRLTRAEYNHTVRDLVGLDLKPADAFPVDGAGGEGFDTNGAALFTNPILMEKYLDAAVRISEAVLPDGDDNALAPDSAAVRKRILVATPDDATPPREAARKVLEPFVRRAYRRPTTAEDLERLRALFDRAQSRGDSYIASLRLAIQGVFISPHFLFLVEPEPAEEGVQPLAAAPLASRLSYFLWSSMPDDELLALAESGKLVEPDVLRGQVRRMLADPRSHGLAEQFGLQWLDIDSLGFTKRPDGGRFPEFDDDLAAAMKTEAITFVAAIIREDRSLLDFLDSNYTFVNERLARHYGIADVQGSEFRQVALTDRNRGGLVGMAAILTNTSYPLRTSPVLRGKWLLTEVFGGKVLPPPPNVPSLSADDKPTDGLTLRQRLEQHRKDANCAACHKRLDPLGFGLENFDAIGRWRTDIGGQSVDSSGKLSTGETFNNPAELKQVLLANKQDFLRTLTRKMFGYALGRELNRFDECVTRETIKALEAGGYRSSILFEQIVLSYPFTHRYVKK